MKLSGADQGLGAAGAAGLKSTFSLRHLNPGKKADGKEKGEKGEMMMMKNGKQRKIKVVGIGDAI